MCLDLDLDSVVAAVVLAVVRDMSPLPDPVRVENVKEGDQEMKRREDRDLEGSRSASSKSVFSLKVPNQSDELFA